MTPIQVTAHVREALRLLREADQHASPCVAEIKAAAYLLDRAVTLIEFDRLTVPAFVPTTTATVAYCGCGGPFQTDGRCGWCGYRKRWTGGTNAA